MARAHVPKASAEVADVQLGDLRLERRASAIVDTLAESPAKSFPALVSDDGELEALYRFMNNDRVTPEALLEPHYLATAKRATAAGRVIVIHDTTGYSFGGETRRAGLGRLKGAGTHASQGFYSHVALVAGLDDGVPLGVIGVTSVVREHDAPPAPKAKRHDRHLEFQRWQDMVTLSSKRLADADAVHVMDREADAYSVFCELVECEQQFVIRSKDDRALDVLRGDESSRLLSEAVERATYVMSRDVQLSTKRPDRMNRLRNAPGRMLRNAVLRVSSTHVEIRHPPYVSGRTRKDSTLPRTISLNVVHACEVDTPAGQTAVDWLLLTSLPVETARDVELVIDTYRRRWLIEEYFKAMKTGCAFEKRQLETKDALLRALALFTPIAWRLLLLRHLAREHPLADAPAAVSARQLMILQARGKRILGANPTTRTVMLAIAAEGGHIRNNGDPGWQVLGRGFEKLLDMELGYVLAMQQHAPQPSARM